MVCYGTVSAAVFLKGIQQYGSLSVPFVIVHSCLAVYERKDHPFMTWTLAIIAHMVYTQSYAYDVSLRNCPKRTRQFTGPTGNEAK